MSLSVPTFFGYHNAQRSLLAAQVALNTINHNIANVNTPGYSRQRVDLATGVPYPPATFSNFVQSGQIGQSVVIQDVSRSHDNFLDTQIRIQSSLMNYHLEMRNNLQQIEGVIGGIGGTGIDTALTDFFTAVQALSVHPEDMASRNSFIQSARNLVDVFREQGQQLQDLRTNLVGDPTIAGSFPVSQANIIVGEINDKLEQVANLNKQILTVVGGGGTPNDLLDKRDLLLQELSERVNITVDYKPSNQVDVSIAGNVMVKGKDLVETLSAIPNPGPIPPVTDTPTLITLTTAATDITTSITGGKLGGVLTMGGNDPTQVTIRGILEDLSTLVTEIATQVNTLQATGRDLNGAIPAPPNDEIFINTGATGLAVLDYTVNTNILQDPRLISAALDDAGTFVGVGDGRNALAMFQLSNTAFAGLANTTFHEYFNNQIAQLGVVSKSQQDSALNNNAAIQQLNQRRESLQGVNMEEEMVNLMRFQRTFEASARVMTVMDETVDTLIKMV